MVSLLLLETPAPDIYSELLPEIAHMRIGCRKIIVSRGAEDHCHRTFFVHGNCRVTGVTVFECRLWHHGYIIELVHELKHYIIAIQTHLNM